MQLPWKALAEKAWTWLRPRVQAEIEREVAAQIEKRTGDPQRATGFPIPPQDRGI